MKRSAGKVKSVPPPASAFIAPPPAAAAARSIDCWRSTAATISLGVILSEAKDLNH
jgi:hypothetical protein